MSYVVRYYAIFIYLFNIYTLYSLLKGEFCTPPILIGTLFALTKFVFCFFLLVDNSGSLVERIYVCLNGYQPTFLPYTILIFHSWPFSISLLAWMYHLKYFTPFIFLNLICAYYLIDRCIRHGLDRYSIPTQYVS